ERRGGDDAQADQLSPLPAGARNKPSPALREREGPAPKAWEGEGLRGPGTLTRPRPSARGHPLPRCGRGFEPRRLAMSPPALVKPPGFMVRSAGLPPKPPGSRMTDNIIVDTATRIFADLCEPHTVNAAEEGRWPEALWNALEESGLTLTCVPDKLGGAGAEMIDGFAVLRVAGRFAAPVPLAATLMAGWLLSQAGISAPPGPMTVAPVHEDGNITMDANGKLRGRARHIPFARAARHIAILAKRDGAPVVALVAAEGLNIREGISLAGEPQDTVTFDGATAIGTGAAPAGLDPVALSRLGAAMRAQQMAGALEHILDQSVQWSLDRVQFGRPIAKFQAVQHNLATLAGEVDAAGAAADGAA